MRNCMPHFGDWGNYHDYKDYTFLNTAAGEKVIFTVTGDILFRCVVVCTTNLASAAAASLSFGVVGNNAFFIPDTLATDIDAREVWHDITPNAEVENLSAVIDAVITNGNDVVIDLTGQVDSGVLRFYYCWMPLSNDGSLVP